MLSLDNESVKRLFKAITLITNEEEAQKFFEDICTIKEIQDMAQRLDTAILLSNGKNYQDICTEIGVSTATIGRVSRCLNYGQGGYQLIINKLDENSKKG